MKTQNSNKPKHTKSAYVYDIFFEFFLGILNLEWAPAALG